MRQRGGIPTLIFVIVVIGGFIALVWSNSEPTAPLVPIIPTQIQNTQVAESWQDVLRAGINAQGTPVPTIAIPDQNFVPPTIARDTSPTTTPVSAADLVSRPQTNFVTGATPTPPPPTPITVGGDGGVNTIGEAPPDQGIPTLIVATDRPIPTNPPSLPVPLVLHPNDHYFFIRPIDANRQNRGLDYYEYGTNGPKDNPYKIHEGIDMANPLGTVIRAGGSGTIVYAGDETEVFQNSPSYGGVVVIEHDFSFRGQALYTLYGHIEEPLVEEGQYVQTGDPIALLGNTGRSSGSHVHFEIRLGTNEYGSTYNPVLWMAPYVGHGVIAGKVVDVRGNFLDDADVTLSRGGFTRDTTTTYVFANVGSQVNADPNWGENFTFTDVPVGRYTVEATINGNRVSRVVDVREGITTFIELQPDEDTIQAATPEPES